MGITGGPNHCYSGQCKHRCCCRPAMLAEMLAEREPPACHGSDARAHPATHACRTCTPRCCAAPAGRMRAVQQETRATDAQCSACMHVAEQARASKGSSHTAGCRLGGGGGGSSRGSGAPKGPMMDANAASAMPCMCAGMHVHESEAVASRTERGTKYHSAGRTSSSMKSGSTCRRALPSCTHVRVTQRTAAAHGRHVCAVHACAAHRLHSGRSSRQGHSAGQCARCGANLREVMMRCGVAKEGGVGVPPRGL
jgi:hypothetical protein